MENTNYFNYWFLQALAMLLTSLLLPKLKITGISGLLFMVIGLALVNTFLWDYELFFSIPSNLTVRSAVLLISNGLIFWTLVKLLPGIEIEGISAAVLAPVIFTISTLAIHQYGDRVDWKYVFDVISIKSVEVITAVKQYLQQHQDLQQQG